MILFMEIILLLTIHQGVTQEITFNNYTYTVHTTAPARILWTDAETNCNNLGGHLVTIYSKQIDSLLYYLITDYSCWIGLNDITTEAGTDASAFVWVDGSTSTYRQFATITNGIGTEPTGTDGTTERDCVDFRFGNDGSSDGWDDRECNANVYCYFCQKSGDSRGCDLIYEESCYRAFEVSDGISWLDAQSSCAVWGGDLTSITTERENNLLHTAISDTVSNCWIGLYERDGDGMYQWVDGTVLNYTNWTGTAPTPDNTHDCVQMDTNGAGSWIAADCEGTTNSFVCKYPNNTDTTAGRFGELTNGGKNFQDLSGNTFYFNSSLTLVCGGEQNSNAIQWKYSQQSDLTSSQTLTPTYASTVTGLSWITVNNSQQGYYRCEISSSLSYTIGLYDLSLTTVAVSGGTYTYIEGVNRQDVLLLCDPMDSSVTLSLLRWDVSNGPSFLNPIDIYSQRDALPEQPTALDCNSGGTQHTSITISVLVPILTFKYSSIVGETFSSVYPAENSITVPISTRNITLSINIDGKWNLPDNSNSSNSVLSIAIFGTANAGLYKFYISNWDGVEQIAIQLQIIPIQPVVTANNELIFGNSTYEYTTTASTITWLSSQLNCYNWGGNLATIDSKQIDSLLYYLTTAYSCWIGLNDRTTEAGTDASAFVWADGSTSTYRQFATITNGMGTEPSGDIPTAERDCVDFRFGNDGSSDGWDDRECDAHVFCYFCQKSGDSKGCDLIYEGSCYRAFEVSDGINWLDAQSSCAVWGGDLTSITTERENNLLYTAISDTVSNCWIGLYERDGDGMYQWVDGTALSYTNWKGTAPTPDSTHDCVQMDTNGAGSWIATDCEATSNSFVCKKPSSITDTTVVIQNFDSPTQQVNYTAGDTSSTLYYSQASIPDSSLRWTTDTVTDGADTQYSIEYPNPVLLSRVFSDVGGGVHTLSCFYRMSPVSLVGSLMLIIRDDVTVSISYLGFAGTFSDANNPMFPSPQPLAIPEDTRDVTLTCSLSACVWEISLKAGTSTVAMSPYIISIFNEEHVGNYSLIRTTEDSQENYTTAHVYIQIQLSPIGESSSTLLLPIIIIMIVVISIVIVVALIIVIPLICICVVKKRKQIPNRSVIFKKHSSATSREGNTGYANLADLQSSSKEYIELPNNPIGAEYMTIDETNLLPHKMETKDPSKETPYYSNLANLPSNGTNYETIKNNTDYVVMKTPQSHEQYTPMSAVDEENKFVTKYYSVKEFPANYQQYVVSGMGKDSMFSVEFIALEVESNKFVESSYEARKERNNSKNPLTNILPYDENRVRLESHYFECNYINASYIFDSEFIASIHPTQNTLQDFLQMIYQTEASMVIMLSTRKEKAKILGGVSNRVCYWPKKDQPFNCDPFETHLMSSSETTAFLRQEVSLKHTLEGKSHSFTHCISPIWNEDGTVTDLNFNLLNRVIKQKQDYPLKPIIIHCEDGISKTGVFLTVFNVIKELNLRKSINIFNAVRNLRKQRMGIVPTVACYTTCFSLMNEYCSIHL